MMNSVLQNALENAKNYRTVYRTLNYRILELTQPIGIARLATRKIPS
jgi:hypothetical protein